MKPPFSLHELLGSCGSCLIITTTLRAFPDVLLPAAVGYTLPFQTGLRDAGYTYIWIDDCWMLRDRTENGIEASLTTLSHPPLPKNLLENTDGLRRPPPPHTPPNPSVTSRCGSLRPFIYADVRYIR